MRHITTRFAGTMRFWQRVALACWLLVGVSGAAVGQQTFALRSISFPLIGSNYLDDVPGWTPIPTMIQELKALGANDVKITVSAGSYDSPTDNLPNPVANLNPADAQIVSLLQQFKAAGFQITLFPFVNINFDPNGNLLDTVHAQPTDFSIWMSAHAAVMVRFAQLAQQVGAERFVVFGDEVQPLTYGSTHTADWLNMIAQVRAVYRGQLTSVAYADGTIFAGGNSHIDLTDGRLIDALDLIGIGWYPMPLTSSGSPGLSRLVAGWRHSVAGVDTAAFLQNVRARYNKPIWISDMALHSFSGDNVRPNDIYNMSVSLIADQQEQANEYESLFTVLSLNTGPWFLGVSCDSWNRFPANYALVARFLNSAYGENVKGKLAATTIRQWFTGQRGWGGMQTSVTASGTNISMSLTVNLTVSAADLGKTGFLYVAAALPNGSIYLLSNGVWTLYYPGAALPSYAGVTLGSHTIAILTGMDVSPYVGATILVGYGTDQNDLMNNSKYVIAHKIQE